MTINNYKNNLLTCDQLLISDIDHTLLGDNQALKQLIDYLQSSAIGFGVATGRSIVSAREVLAQSQVPTPDLWITSVGSEIYYGTDLAADRDWYAHIDYQWTPQLVKAAIAKLPGIKPQQEPFPNLHKISYLVDIAKSPSITEIRAFLLQQQLNVQAIFSHQEYLDILPQRASKGDAVNYCAAKWKIPIAQILVAGDSGNDEQMLSSGAKAVVVGNYSAELERLKGTANIYFANRSYAAAILEAIAYYQF
jgi:sucrose-phosphate synthase